MANLETLMGIAGGGQGSPFAILSTANAALTIPNGIRLAFVSVRSDTAPVTVTLPLIALCAIVLSCPDGAANNVTIAASGGQTIFTGATATITGDNLIVLIGAPGATDWQGHVGT